jgi:hypothetical protein
MSTRSLRARLDRLTRAYGAIPQEKDHTSEFTIDPALAKALRDDRTRLDILAQGRPMHPPSTNEEEAEEERLLRARIAERARTISLPAGYGFNEFWDDVERLSALQSKNELPPWLSHLAQNNVEDPDAKEAQLIARIEAFGQGPEGRARDRIRELKIKTRASMSPAVQSELEGLLRLYPESWCHPKDPMKGAYEAWDAAAKKAREEGRQRKQQLLDRTALKRTGE